MRVAIVAPLPPNKGGIAQHAGQVVDQFRADGAEVLAVSWTRQYPALLYRGKEERPQGADSADTRILRWWDPVSWRRVAHKIRAFAADIVWVPWVTAFQAIPLGLLARSQTTVVAHVHNVRPHESLPFSDQLTRFALRPATGFVAHATSIADDLSSLGLTASCIVRPHPPNFEVRAAPLPRWNGVKLLFLGYVRPYKGVDLALDALAELPADYTLTIAGEFWTPIEEWRNRISDAGLSDRVNIRPTYQTEREIEALLASHHILVCPYRDATQSGLVPLAFAAGRPVVATDVGGLAEAVRHGVDGVICRPEADDLRDGVLTAVADLPRLARNAQDAAITWHDYTRAVCEVGGVVP